MLVLSVVNGPDALEVEGVRAADVVFVVRRGWVKDMVSGPGWWRVGCEGTVLCGLGLISLDVPFFHAAPIVSHNSCVSTETLKSSQSGNGQNSDDFRVLRLRGEADSPMG